MTSTRSKRDNFLVWFVPGLLCVVAAAQLYFVNNHALSRWKGGGFGMFTTVDSPSARFLRVYLISETGEVPVLVPSLNIEGTARVSRIDVTTRSVGGRDVRVARYDVQLDGRQAEVWIDPGGQVLRISMPDSGWLATRTEGE